jgi:hypothetical protein
LMSNVAATLDLGFPLEIDSAWYLETVNGTASLFPRAFSLYKLYSLGPDVVPEAVRLTPELELDALEAGYNLIVHAGHGSENSLTAEQNGANAITVQMLSALNNEDTPFVLSCACLAGDFNFDDSAGEILMNAVAGGAVGYLGNTATGLGLAGGSQLIDEMLSYIFGVRNALIGDALIAGHANFSYPSGMELPLIGVIDTVDKDSWEWTQKAAVYFGDPMLPVWTDPALRTAPSVSVRKTEVGGGVALTFVFNRAVTGTLSFATPGHLYKTSLTNKTRTTVAISEDPGSVVLGFFDDGALFVIRRQEL